MKTPQIPALPGCTPLGLPRTKPRTCPDCSGKGYICDESTLGAYGQRERETCEGCDGRGTVRGDTTALGTPVPEPRVIPLSPMDFTVTHTDGDAFSKADLHTPGVHLGTLEFGARPLMESIAIVKGVVRAVNSHEALVEALEAAEHWLQEERENPGQATPNEILRVIAAALAKAKGDS